MKKNKPLVASLFSVAAAFVTGTQKAIADRTEPFATPLAEPVKEKQTHTMLQFAERLLDVYGGRDASGRTHPRERLVKPLEEMVKDAIAEGSFVPGQETKQTTARCPSCDGSLFLAPVGAVDHCGNCNALLEVMQGQVEGRKDVYFRYFKLQRL